MFVIKSFFLLIFCTICLTADTDESCFKDINTNCPQVISTVKCRSEYGGINSISSKLEKLAFINLQNSLGFLKMSTFMKNYVQHREGFEKLYKKMSDAGWDHSKNLINYLAKRGSDTNLSLNNFKSLETPSTLECFDNFYQCQGCDLTMSETDQGSTRLKRETSSTEKLPNGYYELKTLLCAHDKMKYAVQVSLEIHQAASKDSAYDADITNYLENSFVHPYTEKLRELTGHIDVLNKQLAHKGHHEEQLSAFLIDEYLSELYS